jgi:hypothetical protein
MIPSVRQQATPDRGIAPAKMIAAFGRLASNFIEGAS